MRPLLSGDGISPNNLTMPSDVVDLVMTVAMHQPQIHEVVLAPVLLWRHMVYVSFLAIFQGEC